MSETDPETNPPAQDDGGFFIKAAEHLLPHLEHAEADAGRIAADVSAALREHAGTVFNVSSGILGMLKMIDPADASLFAAAQALEPKVYAMAEKAAALAAAALKGQRSSA